MQLPRNLENFSVMALPIPWPCRLKRKVHDSFRRRKLMGLILGVGGRMLFGTERKETHACCFWVVLRQEPDGRSLNWILTGEERG
jgi:hypothetical protein